MNVIMISLERTLLDPKSKSAERMRLYAKEFDSLNIILPTLTKGETYAKPIELGERVTLFPTNSSSKWKYIFDAKRIAKEIHGNSITKWIVTTQDPFDTGAIGYLVARMLNAGLHVQEHGDFFSAPYWRGESFGNQIRYHIGLFVLRRADAVRVVCERTKKTLMAHGVMKTAITKVAMYTPVEMWMQTQPQFTVQEKYGAEKVIVWIGRFVPQKNLPLLIRAFGRVQRELPEVKLVLVGSGPLKDAMRQLVQEMNLSEYVVFEEWTDDPISYIKTADAYALSSNYEGWGRVLIEALAAGVSIVTTEVGCAGEVIEDHKTALVTPLNDEAAFTHALKQVLTDGTLKAVFEINQKEALDRLISEEETNRLFIESIKSAQKLES